MSHDTRTTNQPAQMGLPRYYTRSLVLHRPRNPQIQPEQMSKHEEIILGLLALGCLVLGFMMACGDI